MNRTNEQSVVTHSKATHSAGRDGMKYQVITGERPLWLKFSPASKFEFAFCLPAPLFHHWPPGAERLCLLGGGGVRREAALAFAFLP